MKPEEVWAVASQHPLLGALETPALKALITASRVMHLRARRPVLKEGEMPQGAFFLLQGAVRVFHASKKGPQLLLKLFQAPALFGEMEVMSQRPFLEHVTTLIPSTLLLMPSRAFQAAIQSQPGFARALAFDLAARLCIAADNLKAVAFENIEARLAGLLLDYAAFFGREEPEGVKLWLSLSQSAMASDLAVTRKSLSGALNRLRAAGIISKRDARYVIEDLGRLRALASGVLSLSYRSDRSPSLRAERAEKLAV